MVSSHRFSLPKLVKWIDTIFEKCRNNQGLAGYDFLPRELHLPLTGGLDKNNEGYFKPIIWIKMFLKRPSLPVRVNDCWFAFTPKILPFRIPTEIMLVWLHYPFFMCPGLQFFFSLSHRSIEVQCSSAPLPSLLVTYSVIWQIPPREKATPECRLNSGFPFSFEIC